LSPEHSNRCDHRDSSDGAWMGRVIAVDAHGYLSLHLVLRRSFRMRAIIISCSRCCKTLTREVDLSCGMANPTLRPRWLWSRRIRVHHLASRTPW
jgi:hypothetical protein